MEFYEVRYVILQNGKAPIIEWLNSLDNKTRTRISQRISRISEGNFGDSKKISKDISELRLKFGSGYRIYYTKIDKIVVLLINGGDKSTQEKDIRKANEIFETWRLENE